MLRNNDLTQPENIEYVWVLIKNNNHDKAWEVLQRLQQRGDKRDEQWFHAAAKCAIYRNDSAECKKALDSINLGARKNPHIQVVFAMYHRMIGEPKNAINILARQVYSSPHVVKRDVDPFVALQLAYCFEDEGDFAGSLSIYSSLPVKTDTILYNMYRCYVNLGEHFAAVACFMDMREANGKQLFNFANYLISKKDYTAAYDILLKIPSRSRTKEIERTFLYCCEKARLPTVAEYRSNLSEETAPAAKPAPQVLPPAAAFPSLPSMKAAAITGTTVWGPKPVAKAAPQPAATPLKPKSLVVLRKK